ncbi:mechanosensitive ion channel family protein [Nodosilinea nodulosa]|uniref:mechanosensitive ion channel family protein n=1 Tax=Nodosilinea nodulosa TaxID=416001 RepID=UPI000318B621|nr:mechanosensitive ion channel family protein [Nodosilinea nodulosa]
MTYKPSLHSRLRFLKRWFALGLALLLACGITLALAQPSPAQFSLPDGFGQRDGSALPKDVVRFGDLEAAPVRSPLDNSTLFTIASPTVYDRSKAAAGTPVEQRAKQIEDRLNLAITYRTMDLKTLVVAVARLNNVTVIDVRDDKYPRPLTLVSVTAKDADFNGKPIDALAAEWRDILNTEIRKGIKQYSSDAIVSTLGQSLRALCWMVVATLAVALLKRGIGHRQRVLRQHKRDLDPAPAQEALIDPQQTVPKQADTERLIQQRTHFLEGLKHTLNLDRRLGLWSFLQWLLFWLLVLMWYIGVFKLANQLPGLSAISGYVLSKPLELLAVWFFTGLAIRLSRRTIDRFKATWQSHDFSSLIDMGDAQRRKLRISTIAGAAKGLATVLIATTGLLAALGRLGIPTGSVLAIGGLLGLAISFGSQSLVKDLVNGFLILAEDQYAIGDVIDLGDTTGLVENLNLRVTQLRSGDGELVTLPNSAIVQVKNLTRSWSRVNFSIDVAYHTDPAKALRVLREVAQGLYDDPQWQDKMLVAPDVLGIDSVSHRGMTITTWIQTAPAQQWAVGREFRFRVREALEKNDIEIGTPRQTYALEASAVEVNGHSRERSNQES